MSVRFDGYTATTAEATAPQLMELLMEARCAGDRVTKGSGFFGFSDRMGLLDETGSQWGYVAWGGRQGNRVMLEVKGDRTPRVVEGLRRRFRHRCTRVDSCADFEAPGAWKRLLRHVLSVKRDHGLYGDRAGDWTMPELGRTQYLGAPSSAVRCRLYEKGKQPEYRHLSRPDWCRLEVQVRPAKDAKESFAQLGAQEVWGASKWSRDLAARILRDHVDPHPAGTVYRLTEREAALRWMVKQYGAHLVSLAQDLGGWECVGLTLREMIDAERQRRH